MNSTKPSNSSVEETVNKCLKPMERRRKTPDRWYWSRREQLRQQALEIEAQKQLSPEEFSKWLEARAQRIRREEAA